jgi:EAL domain-containing protein (putative c-di-GMP-specific phosphodiesterase class I)
MANQLHARWEFETDFTGPEPWSSGSSTTCDLAVLRVIDELIRNRRLTTHFQPIYATMDGLVFGFEALARQTAPASFPDSGELFKAASITGCLTALDKLCLENALSCLAETRFLDHDWHLFINICPETFMNPAFSCRIFTDLVRGMGISCERVILEITEESVISNYALFRSSLDSYRQQGFKIAIDDFGAGYAGLKMLSTVEPDFVKIDRHFIADINRSYINTKLVEAVATVCNRIGINVVAEGIERREELTVVRTMGIDLIQGFLLGQPAPSLNASPAMAGARLDAT